MSKDPKILPRSHAQEEIIKSLLPDKTMRFTDLQKQLQLSSPAMGRHLKSLLEQGIIEFTKKGREKHYKLTNKPSKSLERKIDQIYLSYVVQFGLAKPDSTEDSIELLEDMSDTLGSIFLFYIIKSIETGKDYVKTVRTNDFMLGFLEHLLAQILEDDEPFDEIDLESMQNNDELFEKIKKLIIDNKKMKNVKILYNDMRRAFPGQMGLIDKAIKEKGLT